MVEEDYYQILGVSRTADGKTIKASYRKLAMQYHPDRNPGNAEAEARFKAISEAYDCLKDDQKRAAYDRYGKAAFQNGGPGAGGFGGGDPFNIFDDIFEQFMGGGRGRGAGRGRAGGARGSDLRYDLELSLDDAYRGKLAELKLSVQVACEPCSGSGAEPGSKPTTCGTCGGAGKVRTQQGLFLVERTCPTCRGAGQIIADPCHVCGGLGRVQKEKALEVKVPAGVDSGTRIRLAGEGEAGMQGGPPGDLYVFVTVAPHSVFQRDGTTLFCSCPLPVTTAALGGTIEVPSLDGKHSEIKIPAGTQPGRQFRLRGKGMPALQGSGTGDLIVEVEVETPVNLTKRQRELLEEFHETLTGETSPKSTGFFARMKDMFDELTG